MKSKLTGVIPAAGLGTRMGAQSAHLPKALVTVEGQTLIERAIVALKSMSVDRVVIVTGHLGEEIRRFLAAREFGIEIQFAVQERQLGLTHAIASAKDLIDRDFVVFCPDNIFSDPEDLSTASRIFCEQRPVLLMAATVTPTHHHDRARYFTGALENAAPHVYDYQSATSGTGIALTSTGCTFLAQEALGLLPDFDGVNSETKFETYLNRLVNGGKGLLYLLRGTRYDLSAPEDVADYVRLQSDLGATAGQGVSAILLNRAGEILLQHRDDNPKIRYPNHWALFGGSIEPGESPYEAAKREVLEEIDYEVENLGLFREFVQNNKREFAFVGELDAALSELTLSEGQGMDFVPPSELSKLLIRPDDKQTLAAYFGA